MQNETTIHLVYPSKHGIINTEEAGTLVFSGVPAFFVTIVLLVQCSVKQKFIVV